VTRRRHHAISTIVDGMLITTARLRTSCPPPFASRSRLSRQAGSDRSIFRV
jgi:hypothetical protein